MELPFDMHYQPIVSTGSSRLVAVEALLRLRRGTGWSSPASLLAAAERSQTIRELGARVVDRVMRDFAGLRPVAGVEIAVSINASPSELTGEPYVRGIARLAERHGVPLSQVWIEVTETVPIRDLRAAAETLTGLRELGVTTCIDDFGVGWTTPAQIEALPVDIVKIDKVALVAYPISGHPTPSPGARPRFLPLETMIGVVDDLGIAALIEGVEDEFMHRRGVANGCAFSQGWFHGRPQPLPVRD